MGPFGMLCGAVAAALTPFGTLLGPLGKHSELPWTPSDAGGRLVGSHQVLQQKTNKLAEAFVEKRKGGLQNSSASTIFCEKA